MATQEKVPLDSDETSLNEDASRKSDERMNDERVTSVPRLTGSLTTDCDVQSTESASHIEESTEQLPVQETEQDAHKGSELALCQDERMTSVPGLTGSSTTDCDVQSTESASHIDECTEQLSVQETEQDAYKRSELALWQDERMTSVPKLTGSSTTDCDAQSTESASHIEEPTEQLSVQETEQDAHKGSELALCQVNVAIYTDWTQGQYESRFDPTTVIGTKNLADPLYPRNIQYLQASRRMPHLSLPQESTLMRPLRHPEVLPGWQLELVHNAITGQYERLLKGILDSPPCSQTYDTICLDLGKGHTQRFPLFDVSHKGGESLLHLALEGVMMADNASENLELLRGKMPDFPYPLYLLYKARLASAACNTSECKWVFEKCQALLHKNEYNRGKYRSWIINALGLTVRHLENNDEGWECKAGYHIHAHNERNFSTREDDLDVALLLLDQTKTKQSHSLAIAYKGTEGKFPTDEKMNFNLEAKGIHDEAMYESQKLLHLLGMKNDPADSPSNLMITLRYDGTLRILRIEQTKLLTITDPIEKESMIEQHVKHIEGENKIMGDILGNCCMMVDESLLQKMTKRFNDTLTNVRKGVMTFYTLDDVRTSE